MSIAPVWKIGTLTLTSSPYLIPYGTDYGTPDTAADVLRSLLTDGDLELTSRRGNRSLTLPVLLEGSFTAMAAAEAALFAEVDKSFNKLYCDPGDGAAPAMNFIVNRGQMTLQRDDDYEQAGYRLYELTWRALPWPQAATKTLVSALAASGTTTTSVNAFTVTTGITGTVDGVSVTPSTSGTAVTVASTTALSGPHTITATIAGAITTSSTKFLFQDWKAGAGNQEPSLSATGDGVALTKIGSAPSPTAGYTRTWFYVAASSIATSVVFTLTTGPANQDISSGGGVATDVIRSLTLDQLSRTDVRPTLGGPKQQIRSLPILGSAPTVGTIAVQHATEILGEVTLFTCPDDGSGYVPACRTYRVSGNGPNTDSSAPSGFTDTITTTPSVFDVATGALPDGEYLVMGSLLGNTAPTTVTWSATPRMNGVDLAAADSRTTTVTVSNSAWALYRFGMIHLPIMDAAAGPTSVNRLSVSATNGGGSVSLSDLYLFNLTTGRLSQVSCGSGVSPSAGGPSNRLWLDSPAPENDGLGRMLRGFAADRSDAFSAWPSAVSPTVHEMSPGIMKVFTVATIPATAVDVSYEYYRVGHSSI